VHLREPGLSYKETVAAGTAAAARGGFSVVCAMPNVNPAPDSFENLARMQEILRRDACVRVIPVGCITKAREGRALADLEALAQHVCAFSDDGSGVADNGLMREAMRRIAAFDGLVAAHCEDTRYEGNASEWRQIERDLSLVEETKCRYHVCHLSTREGLALVREAKRAGLPVTCETAPHYLTLTAADRDADTDGRFHMNPPLRPAADCDAMVEGLADGAIDCLATDHAPHTLADKRAGAMGVIGLETAFPVVYTALVRRGLLTLPRLINAMSVAPRRIFHLGGGEIAVGEAADLTLLDLGDEYVIDPSTFASLGRNTPFAGWKVWGRTMRGTD